MAIGQRPPMFFAITNNLLTPSIRAIDLKISLQTIVVTTCNNFEKLTDGSFGVKHPERCSFIIPKSPFENKWGAVAKALANIVLFKTKMFLG
jgi:hypothetical protein